MKTNDLAGQVSMFAHDSPCGKTCPAASPADETRKRGRKHRDRTSCRSSRRSSKLKNQSFMLLNLRSGAGNILGPYWEIDPPWLGCDGTLNTSECPRDVAESSLSAILQENAPSKYCLTRKACLGILRRAWERGKELPRKLKAALLAQAGLVPLPGPMSEPTPSAANRRNTDDCLNPWDTQQSRIFTPDSTAPTLAGADGGGGRNPGGLLFTAGFCAGASPAAGSIGYQEEVSPTLKASASGNMMPSILCLNDQGGSVMECSEDVSGTLRAQEHGHQPLVLYDNHGKDARYEGPLDIAPTVVAAYGTGGNNQPLVSPSVFTRKRVDVFKDDDAASTESARQHKDATDLVLQEAEAEGPLLIRRLTPLECERLQGFPDGWTDLPGASDSSRYRALGNSVAIPCVEYIMQGIAMVALPMQ